MILSYDYNTSYDPSAPVIPVKISAPGQGIQEAVMGFIDSGTDATMIPDTLLRKIKARFVEHRHLRGVTGHRISIKRYLVTIHLGTEVIYGVRAVATSSDTEISLGRDVLNQLVITMNGLAQVVEISA